MKNIGGVRLLLRVGDPKVLRKRVARKLRVHPATIVDLRIRRESIDARKSPVQLQYRVDASLCGSLPPEPSWSAPAAISSDPRKVIIVGSGPAGLFAGLRCLELGAKPILLERGKDASARRFDLAPLLRRGEVIPESNYCFGEGGAGTFSDGKLYTRATKRGPVREVYEALVAHGAPERILIEAHPHVGSNLLPNVVKALRNRIRETGGEVHFQSRVTGFLRSERNEVRGVILEDGSEWQGDAVILATGHSARDIYRLLEREGIPLEQKPFAMGMRVEHPQALIDQVQYHLRQSETRPDCLPAARYRLATKIEGRGVHSFCMCPGGFIVPSATENDQVVVNGMSLSRRDSAFANSGMVVTVEPEDTKPYQKEHGVLAGIAFQEAMERGAKRAGGGGQVAPAQRLADFLQSRDSSDLPETSYFPGVQEARLDELLPAWMTNRLRKGLQLFGRQMRGFHSSSALLLGWETRTSSPVRVPRDEDSLEHPEVRGLFPCGEGAGYAGGIVSAALDGRKCAEAALAVGKGR
ncbi:MAG: FAD-dependent oxidoreductase [Verrucomicrobiota bacterium]